MVEKDDWRLLNDVEYLRKANINPTDGEEICRHAPHLKHCEFCLEPVQDNLHQWWFVPTDLSCCICEECYNEKLDPENAKGQLMGTLFRKGSKTKHLGKFKCLIFTCYVTGSLKFTARSYNTAPGHARVHNIFRPPEPAARRGFRSARSGPHQTPLSCRRNGRKPTCG